MNEPKFQENQVVKIKSYEELKADEYHLLYSDERLKEVAQTEVAIYKVINDLRAVTWYQVGQCGHNVIEIPETYIKGVVNFEEKCNAPDDSYQRDFYEFSNMIRAAVWNRQYTDRDLEILFKESLKELESKQEKTEEAEIIKMKEDLEKFFSGMWKHHPASFLYNKDSKFKPGMLTYDSAAESSKDESVVTDRICVRGFLKVPQIYIESIPHSKTILEAIRKYSAKEEELPYTYQDVLKMLERQLEMFSTRWYGGKLRTEGLISCLKEIEDINNNLKTELYKYMDKDGLPCNSDLVTLSMFAIQTIIYLENPKEKDNKLYSKYFYDTIYRMSSKYEQQQKNFSNFFLKSLEEEGIIIAKIQIGDSINKYSYLIKDNENSKYWKETLIDILINIANYCVMTIMWMDKQRNNQPNK